MPQKDPTPLDKLIAQAAVAQITPEKITTMVKERADKLVDEAMKETLSSYGPVGQVVKAAVKDALKIENLDLPSYAETVTLMLSRAVGGVVAESLEGKIRDIAIDLFSMAPRTAVLSELVQGMVENHYEYESGCWSPLVTCGVRWHDRVTGDDESCTVWLDELNPNLTEREAEVSMHVYKGKVLSVHIGGRDVTKGTLVGVLTPPSAVTVRKRYGIADRCLAMFACDTQLTIDEENVRHGREMD